MMTPMLESAREALRIRFSAAFSVASVGAPTNDVHDSGDAGEPGLGRDVDSRPIGPVRMQIAGEAVLVRLDAGDWLVVDAGRLSIEGAAAMDGMAMHRRVVDAGAGWRVERTAWWRAQAEGPRASLTVWRVAAPPDARRMARLIAALRAFVGRAVVR